MHASTVETFELLLPPLAVALWVLMYAIYLWHEPAFRGWLERKFASLAARRKKPITPAGAIPLILRRPSPPAPMPPRAALAIGAGAMPAATVRIAEWRADHLPLRYRLLGRVRPAANDN